jgi:hypothetical protein
VVLGFEYVDHRGQVAAFLPFEFVWQTAAPRPPEQG